jgi:cob(I)alamin adenosyltransferase
MAAELPGLIQIYTGDGKGKTTAALGQALRAWGHGWRVLVIQFMKGRRDSGEVFAASKLEVFDIVQYGRGSPVNKEKPSPEDISSAKAGLERAREEFNSAKYDLVVLDELNSAIDYQLLAVKEVLDVLAQKPSQMEVIITGRGAPPELLALADLVSEVKEIKHPFDRGIGARKGIEY